MVRSDVMVSSWLSAVWQVLTMYIQAYDSIVCRLFYCLLCRYVISRPFWHINSFCCIFSSIIWVHVPCNMCKPRKTNATLEQAQAKPTKHPMISCGLISQILETHFFDWWVAAMDYFLYIVIPPVFQEKMKKQLNSAELKVKDLELERAELIKVLCCTVHVLEVQDRKGTSVLDLLTTIDYWWQNIEYLYDCMKSDWNKGF